MPDAKEYRIAVVDVFESQRESLMRRHCDREQPAPITNHRFVDVLTDVIYVK